jgi:hypothetical protein
VVNQRSSPGAMSRRWSSVPVALSLLEGGLSITERGTRRQHFRTEKCVEYSGVCRILKVSTASSARHISVGRPR